MSRLVQGLKIVRLRWAVVVAFLLTVGVLSFYGDRRSLDQDESFSAWISRPGWENIRKYIIDDPHAPLYYGVLSSWIALGGESETWLRIPSGLTYLGGLVLIWVLGRHVFSPRQMRCFMVAMAVNQLLLYKATEARMYGFLSVEAAIAIIAYLGMLGGRMSLGIGATCFFLANLAGVFTHYYYFLLMGSMALHVLITRRLKLVAIVAGCEIVPAVCFAILWGPVFLDQLRSERFLFNPDAVSISPIRELLGLPILYFGKRTMVVALPCLLLLMLVKRVRGRRRLISIAELKARFRAIAANPLMRTLAFIALSCLSLALLSILKTREFKSLPAGILTLFPALMMVVLLFERMGDALLRSVLALLLMLGTLGYEGRARHRYIPNPQSDRAWILRILKDSHPGDTIICCGGTYYPIVDYYQRHDPVGQKMSLLTFPPDLKFHPGWYNETKSFENRTELEAAAAQIAAGSSSQRIWVFSIEGEEIGPLLIAALKPRMTEVERIEVKGNVGRFTRIQAFDPLPPANPKPKS